MSFVHKTNLRAHVRYSSMLSSLFPNWNLFCMYKYEVCVSEWEIVEGGKVSWLVTYFSRAQDGHLRCSVLMGLRLRVGWYGCRSCPWSVSIYSSNWVYRLSQRDHDPNPMGSILLRSVLSTLLVGFRPTHISHPVIISNLIYGPIEIAKTKTNRKYKNTTTTNTIKKKEANMKQKFGLIGFHMECHNIYLSQRGKTVVVLWRLWATFEWFHLRLPHFISYCLISSTQQ